MPKLDSKSKSDLGKKLEKSGAKTKKKSIEPLWKGPEVDGVTQSLIGSYLCCKERFRLKVIEGLAEADTFNHRLEYGNMWHACEEEFARTNGTYDNWERALLQEAKKLVKRYPLQQPEIDKWYNVCKTQFPIYISHWKKHSDVKNRTPLLSEEIFRIPYELPSGRSITLRGKWDSIDLVGKGKNARIWLQENKAQGDPEEDKIARQLLFDLQTMTYLVALYERLETDTASNSLLGQDYGQIAGVRYNVIRRPLSGGKGSIRQLKPTKKNPQGESSGDYYNRLGDIVREAEEPDGSHHFFMRWNVDVTLQDIQIFKDQFLNPVLENICDDYEWWEHCKRQKRNPFNYCQRESGFPHHQSRHYRFPFGVYNPLTERGASELDEYLATGSMLGLEQIDNLFPELES